MLKGEVKTPFIVIVAVIALALIGFGLKKALSAGDLDQGQVKYTPGVPPWMEKDPTKKTSEAQTNSPNSRGVAPAFPPNQTQPGN